MTVPVLVTVIQFCMFYFGNTIFLPK